MAIEQRQWNETSACQPACQSACLPASRPVCLPACQSACLPACQSASLPVCLPVCLPACQSACQSSCLSAARCCLYACLLVYMPCMSTNLPACGGWVGRSLFFIQVDFSKFTLFYLFQISKAYCECSSAVSLSLIKKKST